MSRYRSSPVFVIKIRLNILGISFEEEYRVGPIRNTLFMIGEAALTAFPWFLGVLLLFWIAQVNFLWFVAALLILGVLRKLWLS